MLQGKLHDAYKKNSPREWWAILRDLRSNAKWEDPDQHASIDDLTNFFQLLYNTPTEDPSDQQTPAFSSKAYFKLHGPSQAQKDLLSEAPISPKEISMAIKNLSSVKATGLDNISNEMLQIAAPSCRLFLQLLFNKIYSTSYFPSPWKTAYITTLHKNGNRQDPANYHPISITSCFGKLFTSILNTRLMHFMQEAYI